MNWQTPGTSALTILLVIALLVGLFLLLRIALPVDDTVLARQEAQTQTQGAVFRQWTDERDTSMTSEAPQLAVQKVTDE